MKSRPETIFVGGMHSETQWTEMNILPDLRALIGVANVVDIRIPGARPVE